MADETTTSNGQTWSILQRPVYRELAKIKRADVVIGIPSFEAESTISGVVSATAEGAARYFPHSQTVLVVADGGSSDKTRDVVETMRVPRQVRKIVTIYRGLSGKGSAFRTIFEVADRLDAKVCLVFDSDLRSITPEWVHSLAEPIYKFNYGFVTPFYQRYKYDATITNNLVYPLTRALYGHDVRQPIGGEFGMTWALIKIFRQQGLWDFEDIQRFGIDIWMTTTAIAEGFRTCQVGLGLKLHESKDPSTQLLPMFRQVVGTLFHLMRRYETKWPMIEGSRPCKFFGVQKWKEPDVVAVEPETMLWAFKEAQAASQEIWEVVLTEANQEVVEQLLHCSDDECLLPASIWAKMVYDFAIAYNRAAAPTESILEALIPLFLVRVAAFVRETETLNSFQAEKGVQDQAALFEATKHYLVKRWAQTEVGAKRRLSERKAK